METLKSSVPVGLSFERVGKALGGMKFICWSADDGKAIDYYVSSAMGEKLSPSVKDDVITHYTTVGCTTEVPLEKHAKDAIMAMVERGGPEPMVKGRTTR